MNKTINNKTAFTVYAWTRTLIFFILIWIAIAVNLSIIAGYRSLMPERIELFIIPVTASVIFLFFSSIVRPAYIEADISYESICIKTFNSNPKNRSRIFLLVLFMKHLKVYTIDRHSYNNYRISIERFGFRKSLILQKLENGKLYESHPINISFLGAQKYTDLILAMARLREKISLN